MPKTAFIATDTRHANQVVLEDNGDVWLYNHLGWKLKKLLGACHKNNRDLAVVDRQIYLLLESRLVHVFNEQGHMLRSYFASHVAGHSWVRTA